MASSGPRENVGRSCLRGFPLILLLTLTTLPASADGDTMESADQAATAPWRRPVVRVGAYELWIAPGDYDVSVSQESLRTKVGLGMGGELVVTVFDFLDVGLHVFGLRRDGREGEVGNTSLIHFGGLFGPSWSIHDRVLLGLAVMVGFHVLSFADAEKVSTGLGLGTVARASISPIAGFWLQLQFGVLAQPVGGHEATDITLPPTWFGGLGFALAVSR